MTFRSQAYANLAIAGAIRNIASVAFYVNQAQRDGLPDPTWNEPTVANRGKDLDGYILQSWGRPDGKLYNLPGYYL
jgi:hypothetical protein